MKKYCAEALGTCALTLAVGLSLGGTFPVPTPVVAALTLALFVYTIGSISGAHLNPAMTIGIWTVGKIKNRDALFYIVSQLIGAGVAYFLIHSLVFPLPLKTGTSILVGVAELWGALFFAFGIAAVIYGKVASEMSGFVVGGSLLLGITLAAPFSNGILNPAVALGLGSFSLMYAMGPIVGAVAGFWLFRWLSEKA